MARLRLMCGVAGSGKSTHARALEQQGWVRFSIDAEVWAQGFRSAAEIPADADAAAGIRARQREEIAAAVRAGRDVVVDYSFWSRAQRDDYRELGRAHGAEVDVVLVVAPEPVVRARLADRRGDHADGFVVDEELLERYLTGFEAPGPDEPDVTVVDGVLQPGEPGPAAE